MFYVLCLMCISFGIGEAQQFRPNPRLRYNRRLDTDVPEILTNDVSLCPERNGRFAHSTQCDAYTECIDGVPTEKLCPDGLLFNPKLRFSYPCSYPVDVDCTGRSQTQPSKSTEDCPHSYGFFKVGDENNCGKFINCVEGRAYKFDCPFGLAFDESTIRCDWPDLVSSCNAEAYVGFTCPATDGQYGLYEYQTYRSPSDCQKYFVCLSGKPRVYTCPEGQGYNDETKTCDDIANVPGCIFDQTIQEPEVLPDRRNGRK